MIIHDEAHCRFLQEDPRGTAYMEYTCAGIFSPSPIQKSPMPSPDAASPESWLLPSMNGPAAITISSTPNALT